VENFPGGGKRIRTLKGWGREKAIILGGERKVHKRKLRAQGGPIERENALIPGGLKTIARDDSPENKSSMRRPRNAANKQGGNIKGRARELPFTQTLITAPPQDVGEG